MRIPRRDIPAQPLTYLWERHKEIARRVVVGERPIDIAASLNMTTCRLSIIMNSPAFKSYVNDLRSRTEDKVADIRGRIYEGAERGVEKLLTLLENKETPDRLVAQIAQDFLDRNGNSKITKVHTENVTVHLTADRLEELKRQRADMLERSRLSLVNG